MFRIAVVATLLSLFLCASPQEAPEKILQKAIALHKAGNVEGAIEQYRAYLKARPESVDARSNLGAALAGTGRYSEAIPEYQEALKHGPKNPRVWLNLALAYYKSGQITRAVAELSALHAVQPSNAQVSLLLGDCWLRQGEDAKVIELLTPLEKQNPGDLAVAYMLGTALIRNKQVESGQAMIDRILRNGDSAEARLLLGTAKLTALDYNAAIADLQKAVELNPRLPEAYSYLGRAQMDSGNMAAARAAFEKELEQNPNDFESNLNLAVLLKEDQDYDQARKLLDRAIRVRPGDLRVRYQQGAIDLATGNIQASRATMEEIVKKAPTFVEGHISLAQIYYRLKRKADGDRERAIVQSLKASQDAK